MPKITRLVAREILDSRGNPTIECAILSDTNHYATASVPSGASTGKTEALELRDHDQSHYHGMGVQQAIHNINQVIAPKLIGLDPTQQAKIDQILIKLDNTSNKTKLGANAILTVSIANLKLSARINNLPLFQYIHQLYNPQSKLKIPAPIFNLINGGKHGGGDLDFQEFQIIPSTKLPYPQALRLAVEIYQSLKQKLVQRQLVHSVGDEGGFAPNLSNNAEALKLLTTVIQHSSYQLNRDVFLGLDIASDSFLKDKHYHLKDSDKPLDAQDLINFYQQLFKKYPLLGLEDPLSQQDISAWSDLGKKLSTNTILIGDDLVTTNTQLLQQAINKKACTGVIVKPNQIGTISETIQFINLAHQHNLFTITSHRSGETNDTFIADFAVGMNTHFVKFGAPARGERVAKYNRLLEIDSYLHSHD